MTITKQADGAALRITLVGRLDTTTSPDLEKELQTALDGVEELTFDFTDLEYISSAGLRVLLTAQKKMNRQGEMVITGVNDTVNEVFEITGFCDILTIE